MVMDSNTLAQLPRLQATINARHFRLLHKTAVTPEVTPAHALSPFWMTSRWYCRKLLDDSGISRLSRWRAHVLRSQQVAPQDMILWPLAIQGQESGEQPRTPSSRGYIIQVFTAEGQKAYKPVLESLSCRTRGSRCLAATWDFCRVVETLHYTIIAYLLNAFFQLL